MTLELGKGHFDGVEVRAIGGQVAHARAFGGDQPGDGGSLVDAKIVEDDDIAGLEFGQRTCLRKRRRRPYWPSLRSETAPRADHGAKPR
jgi:hypothetical protein